MSYSNNPNSILAGTGISITPTSGTGSNTITISATGTQTLSVRNVTETPVAVTDSDDVIVVEVDPAEDVTINLPVGTLGRVFNIKDGLGNASVPNPITIVPDSGTIDGDIDAVINTPYGSLTLIYNGTQWLIL